MQRTKSNRDRQDDPNELANQESAKQTQNKTNNPNTYQKKRTKPTQNNRALWEEAWSKINNQALRDEA